jgi:hypothetical protein
VTRDPRLAELRAEFKLRTSLNERGRPRPCWFAGLPQVDTECRGVLQACHFIKQQRIRKELTTRLKQGPLTTRYAWTPSDEYEVEAPIWDPRLGVNGCLRHHNAFDGGMPPLYVYWSQIPAEVISWAEEYGFVWSLEREHPKEDESGEAA